MKRLITVSLFSLLLSPAGRPDQLTASVQAHSSDLHRARSAGLPVSPVHEPCASRLEQHRAGLARRSRHNRCGPSGKRNDLCGFRRWRSAQIHR